MTDERRSPLHDRRMLEALVCPVTQAVLTYDAERQELISQGGQSGLSDPRRHPDHAGVRGAQDRLRPVAATAPGGLPWPRLVAWIPQLRMCW